MTAPALLEVDSVTLRFGGVVALDRVSCEVHPGELFAIIGPNGAGKSSLFNCVSGLARPEGSIRLRGSELVGRRPHDIVRLGIGRTFQNLGLFNSLNVIDNLMVGRHVRMSGGLLAGAGWFGVTRRSEAAARARCHELVDLLGLTEHRHTRVSELPYGIRKRVEIGKAVAMDPVLLLLDEPVAGMNREETEQVVAHLTLIREQLNLTIILIEHDMHLVMGLADRVLALDFGHVMAAGPPQEVQRDPRVIEAYLGVDKGRGRVGTRYGVSR